MNDPIQFWAYLHANGTVQVKRWFGDVKDYTTDCDGNDFVRVVVEPFTANSREEAERIAVELIKRKLESS